MVQKVFTAKNGRKYIKNKLGQVRFISDKSKKGASKSMKKSTKKGGKKKKNGKKMDKKNMGMMYE